MLITFINIPSHKNMIMTVYPPVGILSMSACLKQAGNLVNYIDADILRLEPMQVISLLEKDRPNLIGISLNISQVFYCTDYLSEIQKRFPNIPTIVGGPYVTGMGKMIFSDFPSLKYAVVNEGEYAIVDFVDFLKGIKQIENVRNLLYVDDGKIIENGRERIKDLDSLPLPDYSLVMNIIDHYKGAKPSIASPSIAVMCTRGCPYNCSFCSSPANWERKITFRSTDSIMKEIIWLKKNMNVKEIFFQDDTLNARKSWFFELCEKIMANGLHKEIYFKCPFRANANILTEDILEKARDANFWMIFYGVENGNQTMLNRMNKNITIKEIRNAFRLTRKFGLASYASFMIGNEGETKSTVKDSLKLMRQIMPDYGGFAIAAPFPGSELFHSAVAKDLITLTDFKNYQFGDCILRSEALSIDDIKALAEDANSQFLRMKRSIRYKWANRHSVFNNIFDDGFYEPEFWHTWVRRTMSSVFYQMPYEAGAKNIHLKVLSDYPDISQKPVKLKISVNNVKEVFIFDKNEWQILTFPIRQIAGSKLVSIKWNVSRVWNPKKYGINEDSRDLGITVENIWME